MSEAPKCPYCETAATLTSGREVYPHRCALRLRKFWVCRPCDAWVGCHARTSAPLGTLASRKLRRARMRAHLAFDPIWQAADRPAQARTIAYAWLAKRLGVEPAVCHIGQMDIETCHKVIEACEEVHDDIEI